MDNRRHCLLSQGLASIKSFKWFKAAREPWLPSLRSATGTVSATYLMRPDESVTGSPAAGRMGQRMSCRPVDTPGALHWPDIDAMLPDNFALTWSRRAKYKLRLWRTRDVRQRMLDECARVPFAAALLDRRPRAFHPLTNHLLDRRLGAQARLDATIASIRRVCDGRSASMLSQLLTDDVTLITLADGMRLTLSLSGVSFHEGLWQVGLIAESGTRLYSLGFGFTDVDTVLIANVQGPSIGHDGLALVREATQAAHGMRPAHFLLHALRLLVAEWGVQVLLGIDPNHHVKGRRNLRRNRLRFDYRAFWTEVGATPHPTGNWSVPLDVDQRPLADVPAKRRAMYRRRYEMLAQLESAVAAQSAASDRGARTDPRAATALPPACTPNGCLPARTSGSEHTRQAAHHETLT